MTATALKIASEDALVTLSPARAALRKHQDRIAELKADADRLSRPVSQLRDQLERAEQQVATARAELDQVDADHAAAIADAARSADGDAMTLPKAPASASLRGRVGEAERAKANVEAALRDCEAEHDRAAAALRSAIAPVDGLMLAVIENEFAAALDRRELARAAFIAADAEAMALARLFGEHGRPAGFGVADPSALPWLRAGEMANAAYGAALRLEVTPRDVDAALARWSAALERLATDATARAD